MASDRVRWVLGYFGVLGYFVMAGGIMSEQERKLAGNRARDLQALAEHYWHLARAPQTPLAARYHHMEVAEHLETILCEWERESGSAAAQH